MRVYSYDPHSYEYVGTELAEPDPLDQGEWLIPAHSTELVPPDHADGYVRKFINNAWELVEITEEPVDPEPPQEPEIPEPVKNIIEAPQTLFGGPALKEILYGN